jgi:lysozyme
MVAAACAMEAWRKSEVGGELTIVDALVRRRAAEKALFLKDCVAPAAPSVFVRPQLDYAASILGAPVAYTSAPEVGSIPVARPTPAPGPRLTEILKSEPATETLLLTQVVPPDDEAEQAAEITTAHAKPVSRFDFEPRSAARRVEQKPASRGWLKPAPLAALAVALKALWRSQSVKPVKAEA